MPLFGIVAYTMSALTLYTVTLPYTKPIMSWLNPQIFMGFIFLLCLFAMFVNYKFLYPSYFKFLNQQTYAHENPALEKLKVIEENQNKIMKKLGIE